MSEDRVEEDMSDDRVEEDMSEDRLDEDPVSRAAGQDAPETVSEEPVPDDVQRLDEEVPRLRSVEAPPALGRLARQIESLLFLSNQPVTEIALAEACEAELEDVASAVEELEADLAPGRRGLILRRVGGGLILASDPESESAARRLLSKPRTPPLTQAQAETLAIVAYLQPVARPEIARIRGVSSESAVNSLSERGLIEEAGRSRFGAAIYRTSPLFEKVFGLDGLDALPDPSRFDPTPDDEREIRERLLAAGEQRAEG